MNRKLVTVLTASVLCLTAVVVLARCEKTSEDADQASQTADMAANGAETAKSDGSVGMSSGETDAAAETVSASSTPTPAPTDSPTPSPSPSPSPSPTPTPVPHVVVLDPGHGGKWSGAWYNNISEKDITLKVANYARAYLEANYKDVVVYLTREGDEILDSDIAVDLEKRVLFAADKGAEAFVSIHFNACDNHNLNGAEVWSSRRAHMKESTYALGRAVLDELVALGLADRGVNTRKSNDMKDENGIAYDYYGIVRHCATYNVVGVIVEHCFMDNATDSVFVSTEEGLRSLGEADARGIAAYLGLEK